MTLRIGRFAGTGAEWDAFGETQSGWTAFHRHAWRPLIEELYGHECLYLDARDAQGVLRGVLPLVRVRSRLFGHFLVSVPFVSYGGPLGSDAAIVSLVEHAQGIAQADGARLLELRSARELPIEMPVSHRKVTVVLDLQGGAEAVLKRLKPKLRSQTRRPAKEGVTFAFGADRVDDFHAVFARHMRDLGTPAQPKAFFRGIAERFGDAAWFGCAYLDGRAIACGAGFQWNGQFEITWASALREFNQISPNMGLYWAFIERAANAGLTCFNFGRCTPGSNTHKFKLQWGAVDEPLWWYQRLAEGGEGIPNQSSPTFALATRIWRRLPVRVATALGPRIVRYLP
jgi:FemAB-related protein (PEP-CTERM system-associated)